MDAGAAAQKGGKKGGKKGGNKGQPAGGKAQAAQNKPQQQGKGQQKGQPQQQKGKPQQQPQQQGKGKAQQKKAAPVKEEKAEQKQQQQKAAQQKKVAAPPQKKAKADEEQVAEAAELSEAAQKELAQLQEELANIAKDEMKAVAKITREFNAKRRPTLEKRKAATSKIPGFWLQALANTPAAGLITDADAEIFKFLKDVSVIEPTNDEADKDKSDDDFKIVFTFDKNPFFQNKQLWKEVKYPAGADEEQPPTITGSTINWNKGKNPMEKKAAPAKEGGKQKGKRSADAMEEEDEEDSSFFEWFSSTELETVDLGEWFRDKFFPNAVKYFFGDVSDDEEGDFSDLDSEEEAEFARKFAGFGDDEGDDDDEEDGDE